MVYYMYVPMSQQDIKLISLISHVMQNSLSLKIASSTAFKAKCHSIVSEMFILRNELNFSLSLVQT